MKSKSIWHFFSAKYLHKPALLLCFALMAFQSGRNTGDKLIVCGNSKVMIVQEKSAQDTIPKILWTWDATLAKDLPEKYRLHYFKTIDECKPMDGGRKILITSSGGGVAIVNRADKKVLFYAYVAYAHSAELLPGDKVVVTGSGLPGTKGNSLEVFDIHQSEKRIYRDTLARGHGVIWDKDQRILYALGYDILNEYTLVDWDGPTPALKLRKSHRLPSHGGHDLQRYTNSSLFVSTSEHTWIFDKIKQRFEPFEPLKNSVNIKSLSSHPISKRIIYTVAEESWWTHRVYFLETNRFLAFPDINVYKARWVNSML